MKRCGRETSRSFAAAAAILLCACALLTDAAAAEPPNGMAPTGKLRIGIVVAPVQGSPFFVTIDPATGKPRGVTVDLGTELARKLGVPPELVSYPTAAALLDAATSDAWDVTFVNVNRERREREKRVELGAAYYVAESGYLVPANSPIGSIAEVDRPGVRVAARIKGTQALHLSTSLKHATLLLPGTVEEQIEMLRSSKADVIASGRLVLLSFAANNLPGSRILDGSFDSVSVVIAVPKGRLAPLAYANDFIETAKTTGIVLRAFEDAGLKDLTVAPAGAR